MGSGAALVLVGAMLLVIARLGRLRRLPRNWLVGLRTPSTMRSREAWFAAHEAIAQELILTGWFLIAGGLIIDALPHAGTGMTSVAVVVLIAVLLHAASRGISAARAVAERGDAR